MNENKERRLMIMRGCLLFTVLAGWAIYFGYLFLVNRAIGKDWLELVGAAFLPSLPILAGAALACSLFYLIYRTALIKIR